ncbi:hypothetical protein [Psychrobacillus sp.]|uniref:tetratricopeptide repeat protein n=1 Tax=Psychrobacillus sp. TaxID=1871623 RepID=UPI0028BD33B5|nr:hypothetical protein [Psychrobacillus sp.]
MNQLKLKVKTKKKYTNFIITLFILIVCSILIYAQNQATKQDEKLMDDYALYQETNLLLQEGDIEHVLPILEELNKRHGDDFNVTHRLGYSYLKYQQFNTALTMYTKALDLNPYLVENINFMYEYATTLASNEQYDNALIVIERLLTLPIDESFKATITELKDSISGMKGSTK